MEGIKIRRRRKIKQCGISWSVISEGAEPLDSLSAVLKHEPVVAGGVARIIVVPYETGGKG
jgi:hypothetical protein